MEIFDVKYRKFEGTKFYQVRKYRFTRLRTIGKYDFRYTLNSVTFEPDFQSTEVGLKVGYARKLFYRDRS